MNINADTNITSTDYTGISISGNINLTVADGVEAYIGGNYNGISTTGTATSTSNSSITSNGSLTIEGSHGIYMYNGDIKIGGTGTIDIISSNAIIANNGTVTFAESATLILATNGYIWGANNTAYTLNSTKVNGLLRLGTSASFTSTVSGAYVPTSDVAFGGSGTALSFAEGSSLTVEDGITLDLTNCGTITFNSKATITNNGTLLLPEGTAADDINFNGDGLVKVETGTGEYDIYDNQGNYIATSGTIILGTTEIITDDYTWTEGADGVYTLEVFTDKIYGDIEIGVENAIIHLNTNLELDNLYFGMEDWYTTGIVTPTNLTITGAYALSIVGCDVSGIGSLTIGEGTTVDTLLMVLEAYAIDGEMICSDLIVAGTLKANLIMLGNMEVTNTGTVVLTYSEEAAEEFGDMPYVYLAAGVGEKPTITLGEEVRILSPEGAYLVFENDEYDGLTIYYGYLLDEDGEFVTELYIGKKPSFDIDVTVTGEGSASPNSDVVSVLEGFDQTFTFTAAEGYELSDVIVDGVSYGAVTSFTFEEVMSTHTLSVVFTEVVIEDTDTEVPDTSDTSNVVLSLAVMITALLATVVLSRKRFAR